MAASARKWPGCGIINVVAKNEGWSRQRAGLKVIRVIKVFRVFKARPLTLTEIPTFLLFLHLQFQYYRNVPQTIPR